MTLIGGKYRLIKQIGEGAMGVVSSAVNTATGGQVAIKLILRSEPELRQRLVREAQACGAIRHKNVVQVYDVGTTESGDPFLVMELLQGETLAALLARKRRLAAGEACAIARDVARALAAAHAVPIVHRDLKPANIFLHTEPGDDEPIVKVVDFGVSKNLQVSDGLRTVAGGAVGSPLYMSPEQARADRALDHRADLWSLGVVLYEMLTGERPFAGDALEVVHKILQDPIPRVGKRLRKLDPDIDRIVAGCLTRDPAKRLGPALEIAKQLDRHTLGAAREPLPSLMDTGGYESSPLSAAGSGGAALSPGYGPASLVPASPGVGPTDLRPPSGGAALTPSSAGHGGTALSAVRSASAEMHSSGSWDAGSDDDGATIPIGPKVLQARLAGAVAQAAASSSSRGEPLAPPSHPGGWGPGGGGTIPIHVAPGFVAGVGNPASPATAPLPAVLHRPPSQPAPAAASPHRDTVRMDQAESAMAAVAGPPGLSFPVVAGPNRPPAKRRRDMLLLASVAVIVVSVVGAAAILVFGPSGDRPPMELPVTAVPNTAQPPAPEATASAAPTTAAEVSATATPTGEAAPSGASPPIEPTAVPSTNPTAPPALTDKPPQSVPTGAKSAPAGAKSAPAGAKSAPTSTGTGARTTYGTPKPAPTICRSKFGLKTPCPK